MTITAVQGLAGSSPLAFASSVTSGNLLVARIFWNTAATISSVTDTQGNTWTVHASTYTDNSGMPTAIQIASCTAAASGANTVTVTLSSGTVNSIRLGEYNNSSGSMVLDGGVASQGSAGPTISAGSVTTTAANGLGVACFASTSTLGTGYDIPDNGFSSDDGGFIPYWFGENTSKLDLGSVGSVTGSTTFTSGTTRSYAASFAAFKVSGGSPVITTPLTGQVITVAQGTLTPNVAGALAGQQVTVSQGLLSPTASKVLTGQAATFSQGSPAPVVTIALTGQQVTYAQGVLSPSSVPVINTPLTGQATTFSQGQPAPVVTIALIGQQVTFSQGLLSPTTSKPLVGQAVSISQGSVGPSSGTGLVGQQLTYAQGSPGPAVNEALTGQAVTYAQGVLTPVSGPVITKALVGQSVSYSQGSLGQQASIPLMGQSVTYMQGVLGVPGPVSGPGSSGMRRFLIAYYTQRWQKPEKLVVEEQVQVGKTLIQRPRQPTPAVKPVPQPSPQPRQKRVASLLASVAALPDPQIYAKILAWRHETDTRFEQTKEAARRLARDDEEALYVIRLLS